MKELKPCPFCGNTKLEITNTEGQWESTDGYLVVVCPFDVTKPHGCGSTSGFRASEKEVAKLWNNRPWEISNKHPDDCHCSFCD